MLLQAARVFALYIVQYKVNVFFFFVLVSISTYYVCFLKKHFALSGAIMSRVKLRETNTCCCMAEQFIIKNKNIKQGRGKTVHWFHKLVFLFCCCFCCKASSTKSMTNYWRFLQFILCLWLHLSICLFLPVLRKKIEHSESESCTHNMSNYKAKEGIFFSKNAIL